MGQHDPMGQHDKALKVLVMDQDPGLQAALRSFSLAGTQIGFLAPVSAAASRKQAALADVVIVGVDCARGLSLAADLCSRRAMPPVIAIGGAGFDGKSPEHVLLLADLAGAALSLPKPVTASELMAAAAGVAGKRRPGQGAKPSAA